MNEHEKAVNRSQPTYIPVGERYWHRIIKNKHNLQMKQKIKNQLPENMETDQHTSLEELAIRLNVAPLYR